VRKAGALLLLLLGCDGKTIEAFPREFAGVGVELTMKDGFPVVVRVLPGGPAEEMGIDPGDRVVEIDGRSAEGLTLAQAVDRLRGPEGTQVSMQLVGAGGAVTKVVLTRRSVTLKPAAKR
jgi:carboxyl-terminal processing protease